MSSSAGGGVSVRTHETVLGQLSLFVHLRPDEVGRIAKRFALRTLATGERVRFADGPRLVVVVEGSVRVDVESASGHLSSTMDAGDRFGALAVLTGKADDFEIEAVDGPAACATIDAHGFDTVLADYPAVALPLAQELSVELGAKNDLLRQLLELHAEGLPEDELRAAVGERRAALRKRGARVKRLSPRALFHLIVRARGEPPFWILVGFLASLGLARLVVFLILKYKLEKQLFALVQGTDPNPMHVHHFNYGLVLVGAAGLAALFPMGRRALRLLALAFGFGCGLVFDEFALFWNLNPEYAQASSLIAAAIAAVVIVQLVWFRRYWAALARQVWLRVKRVQ